MPELPEVETIKRDFNKNLAGICKKDFNKFLPEPCLFASQKRKEHYA